MKIIIIAILLIAPIFGIAGVEEIFVIETKAEFAKTPLLVYAGGNTQGMRFFRIYFREVDSSLTNTRISISVFKKEPNNDFFGDLQKERVLNAEGIWMVSFSITESGLDQSSLYVSGIRESKHMTEIRSHIFYLNDLYHWNSEFKGTDIFIRGEDDRFNAFCKRELSFYKEWVEGIGTKWIDYSRSQSSDSSETTRSQGAEGSNGSESETGQSPIQN